MNKNDIIAQMAEHAEMTKAEAGRALDAFVETVSKGLSSGEEIRLVGFGTFLVADRKASQGRNPRTGEVIQIAAARLPKFTAGKSLKEAVSI